MNNLYTKNLVANKYKKNIGEYTYGNPLILDWGEGANLYIGKFYSIADNVVIFLGGEHRTEWITTYPFSAQVFNLEWPEANQIKGHPKTKGDVVIGNDVWIGYKTTILSGIKIGDGAVVGTQSVVTKNVDPYTIVAGNPAKLIRKRFDDKIIKKLLQLKWWNWPINKIKENIHILLSNNVLLLK